MKTPRGDHTAARLADGRVLMAGGSHDSEVGNLAQAELYDPATGRFTATGSVATVRSDATATLLSDGRVLIAGGFHPGFPPSAIDSAELYDPTTGKFSPTGSMAAARSYHTATALSDRRILIVGATHGGLEPLASAELYDPKTGKFAATDSMNTARTSQNGTLLSDGRVLISGGYDGAHYIDSAEI